MVRVYVFVLRLSSRVERYEVGVIVRYSALVGQARICYS
jgi:hypothetical protein